MGSSVLLGIFWHFVGAASAACFYAPLKQVKNWSWETMWSIAGLFSWIILPWGISYLLLPDFWAYYGQFDRSILLPVFLFGAMWGIGNINYGLTMRYLGMSMGIGIAIGITLIIGTLMTPILQGKFGELVSTPGGQLTLLGVAIAVIGVAVVSYAGLLKERAIGIQAEEFNLKKGLILAIMCGIFSAGMSFAMSAATPMHEAAAAAGVSSLYVALPSYVIIMGGGAIINLGFCISRLMFKPELSLKNDLSVTKSLLISNTIFAVIGGIMWYLQFFFYAWGHANIPKEYGFMSWMLHMSFYVLCGGIVGLILKEWKGTGKKPARILIIGCLIIILAANIVGFGIS